MITIKDSREIELMRHAGHVVGLVHQELEKWLKPGLTTKEVSDFCEKIIRARIFGCYVVSYALKTGKQIT